MPNFMALDDRRSLTPWSIVEHRNYIAGHYGELLGSRGAEVADAYIEEYKLAQERFLLAYENQRELLRTSAKLSTSPPQELPDPVMEPWDPRPQIKKEAEEIVVESVAAAEEAPKKRGRKPKVAEVTPA